MTIEEAITQATQRTTVEQRAAARYGREKITMPRLWWQLRKRSSILFSGMRSGGRWDGKEREYPTLS